MAHHAYFVAGERDESVAKARTYAKRELGLSGSNNSDIVSLSFGLFSVDDSRRLIDTAHISALGGTKVIIASMTRIFHEAQNALLKVLEEPPEGVTIILCVPSEGVFIPTLRSRLLALPEDKAGKEAVPSTGQGIAAQFLAASSEEREKIAAKLVERSKSDKDETKQEARQEAIELLNGLTAAAYAAMQPLDSGPERENLLQFLEELASFTPILYERSAPLKLIFEHILLVIPKALPKGKV